MPLDWNRYRLTLGRTGKTRCEVGWSIGAQWSRNLLDYDLWVIRAGSGVLHYPGGSAALRPGVALWLRSGEAYDASHDPSNRLAVTAIHFDLLDERRRRPPAADLPPRVLESPATGYFDAVSDRIVALASGETAAACDLLRGVLRDFERSCQEQQQASGLELHHYRTMMQAASRLSEDVARRFSVEELASAAGYSADHFSRLFQRVMGKTPQDYAIDARIERARELLRESPMGIKEIARALGYSSVHFFSRQFSAKAGVSPSDYRDGLK